MQWIDIKKNNPRRPWRRVGDGEILGFDVVEGKDDAVVVNVLTPRGTPLNTQVTLTTVDTVHRNPSPKRHGTTRATEKNKGHRIKEIPPEPGAVMALQPENFSIREDFWARDWKAEVKRQSR
ncbi:unnamed protein product [Natator depressus]